MPYLEEINEDTAAPTGLTWAQVVQDSNRSDQATPPSELFLSPLVARSSSTDALDFSHSSPRSSYQSHVEEQKDGSLTNADRQSLITTLNNLQERLAQRQTDMDDAHARAEALFERINLVEISLHANPEEKDVPEVASLVTTQTFDPKLARQIHFLNRLQDEIDKLKNMLNQAENQPLANFIMQLKCLHETVLNKVMDENIQTSNVDPKVGADMAVEFVFEAVSMLRQLEIATSHTDAKKLRLEIINNYEKNCRQIHAGCYHTPQTDSTIKKLLKITTAVIIAAVGFVFGAAMGASIGMMAGAWSGPGAVATAIVGLVHGAITGASLGLAIGASVTGIAAGSIAMYSMFKPARLPRIEDTSYMVNARLISPGK